MLIPSAVDTQRYRPDAAARERLRAAFGLPADALVVGVVAQLIERKRHAWLFALLPELVRDWPQLRVVCFGRGPLERRLRAELAERGLARPGRARGFSHRSARALAGTRSARCIRPTAKGLGLALLEAASAGVPVVACAVGGVPDVVVDGETGMLVPREDAAALRRALRDLARVRPEERRRLGAAARRHVVRHFDTSRRSRPSTILYIGACSASAPRPRSRWRK